MNGTIPGLAGAQLAQGYVTYGSDSGHQAGGFGGGPGGPPGGFGAAKVVRAVVRAARRVVARRRAVAPVSAQRKVVRVAARVQVDRGQPKVLPGRTPITTGR
jgi:hypothetical protein